MKSTLNWTSLALTMLLSCNVLSAQASLALSSATATPGTPVSLDLTVASPSASLPAGLQWTFTYPASSVSSFVVSAGPAATAAGKTVTCSGSSTGYICLASGINGNIISNGTLAKVAVTLAAGANSAQVGVSSGVGAATDGSQMTTGTTGGSISSGSGGGSGPTLSTVACNPASLSPGAVAACTVTMSAPLAAAATVTLTKTGSVTVPATVSIPAGAATATFSATAGSFTANQTATVTGTLNSASATASLSLQIASQISMTSLVCGTTSLAASATTSCTVTLSGAAPAGGSTVNLVSNVTSAVTVPASVLVPAGATTASFTATAGAVTSSTGSTLTAYFGGNVKNWVISVTAGAPGISVSTLTCSSTSLAVLTTTNCTVTLSKAAPAGGSTVALSSSLTTALTVPASVLVPAGATTATFSAAALGILTDQSSTVTATLNGTTKSLAISVTAGMSVSTLTCGSTTLGASTSTTCTITLSKAAPAGGSAVALASSLTTALTVPASVLVPAAATTATFTATAGAVTSNQSANLTASLSGSTKSLAISVTAQIAVSSLTCTSTTLTGPATTNCIVMLSKMTPAGGTTVALASSVTTALTVPASVLVPGNDNAASFTATAAAVTSNQTSNLSATLNGAVKSLAISVIPPLSVSSLSCASVSLAPSASTTCTVTISKAAPAGGTLVALSSSIVTALTAPASVTVPAGATTTTFTATAGAIITNQNPVLTATLNGSSKGLPFAINGAMSVTSLACSSTNLAASTSTVCTVTLSKAAPAGGSVVTLVSTLASALTIPATVTVPGGATTATFTATAAAVTANQSVTIMAAISGSIQSLAMTVSVPSGVTTLQCGSTTLTSQKSTTCTVTLAKAAAAGGAAISISSTAGSLLTTPATVTIPAGAISGAFPITAASLTGVQTATVRATSGTSSASITIALSPASTALAQLSCTPQSLVAGQAGTCSVTLTAPAPSAKVVGVRSTNANLVVPISVTIGEGSASASFPFTSASSLTGWAIVTTTLEGISKTAVIQAAANSGSSSTQTLLSCDQRHVPAGGSTLCEIRTSSDGSEPPAEFRITSSSDSVKVPATITPRPGAGTTRFEVRADEQARQQNVVIEAKSSAGSAQESLAVLSSGAPLLRLPGTRSVKTGARVAFQVSAVDSQDLPVAVAGKDLPRGATLDPATGDFSWTPGDADLGSVDLLFSASDAAGQVSTGTVRVSVISGKPVISGMRNGAGTGALASCSPGARMTLLGTFVTDDQRGGGPLSARIRVRVNGEAVAVPAASGAEIDFLCPVLAAGTPLSMTVEVAGRVSAEFRTVMVETAPGLFSVSGSPRAQGLVMHARGLAAIPRFDADGTPALAGETIRFYATGLNCENSNQNSILLYFGKGYQPITSITPSSYAGICEVSAVVPEGVFGLGVELFLEAVRSDATLLRSNTISLAIDEPIAER